MLVGRSVVSLMLAVAVAAGFAPTARAEGPVTVTAAGPASIDTTAGRGTGTSWVTFTILDTSSTATSVHACRILPSGKRADCDAVPLVPRDFKDGNWQVVAVPGGWQFRSRIKYYDMSPEECWSAAFAERPYRISVSVRNPADVELATANHPYTVDCAGLAGGVDGPKRLLLHAGRDSAKAIITFYLLDTKHTMKSIRSCSYNALADRYYACQRQHLTARFRTDYGWAVTFAMQWPAMGSAACTYVGRKWPEAGKQVAYYDAGLHKRFTLYHGFRLECRN